MTYFLKRLFRWFRVLVRSRVRHHPDRPIFKRRFSEREWVAFVKSFSFDRLSGPQKRVAFKQIMSFR